MRLVVDTSVLVGELLRSAGRNRLGDDRLELFLPERMWHEFRIELPRRLAAFARRHQLDDAVRDDLPAACLGAVERNVVVLDEAIYAAAEDEARARSLRDDTDWPVVASALVLSAAIWTNDNDFLGTGVATWTTESLQRWLARHPATPPPDPTARPAASYSDWATDVAAVRRVSRIVQAEPAATLRP